MTLRSVLSGMELLIKNSPDLDTQGKKIQTVMSIVPENEEGLTPIDEEELARRLGLEVGNAD